MPFTPLHMGPGMLLKAFAGRYFSLVAFGFVQIAMDIEVLVRIVRDDAVLHGLTHTYAGCLVVAFVSLPILWSAYPLMARLWGKFLQGKFVHALAMAPNPSVVPILSGLLLGALSHVALDGIMHSDMRPLWPFSDASPLYLAIGIDALHLACVVSGVVGLVLFSILALVGKGSDASN